jgi:3-oxoadipate enol-lactonase
VVSAPSDDPPAAWPVILVPTRLGDVAVRRSGFGDPLLFWPSLMFDGLLFSTQAREFVRHYDVILIDPPGQGRSAPLKKPFSIDDSLGALCDVMAGLDVARGVIIGNSWGGMLAYLAAANVPDRVVAFVAMNAAMRQAGVFDRLKSSLFAAVVGQFGFAQIFENVALASFLGHTTRRTKPDVVASVIQQLSAMDRRSARILLESVVVRRDSAGDLARIRVPGLIIGGSEDTVFPPKLVEVDARRIATARLEWLDDVGHLAPVESPQATTRLIGRFLAEHIPAQL